MGGRGTYAAGNNVPYTYETVGYVDDAKVLFGKPGTGLHDLPVEAHSSNVYVKLHKDGTLNMMRVYDNEHYLTAEIAYHPEPDLRQHRTKNALRLSTAYACSFSVILHKTRLITVRLTALVLHILTKK